MDKLIDLGNIPNLRVGHLFERHLLDHLLGIERRSLLFVKRGDPDLLSIKEEGGIDIKKEGLSKNHHVCTLHELDIKEAGVISEPKVSTLAYIDKVRSKNLDLYSLNIDNEAWDVFLA